MTATLLNEVWSQIIMNTLNQCHQSTYFSTVSPIALLVNALLVNAWKYILDYFSNFFFRNFSNLGTDESTQQFGTRFRNRA